MPNGSTFNFSDCVQQQIGQDDQAKEAWQSITQDNYTAADSESERKKVVGTIQFSVEMALAQAMEKGDIKSAVCVIHTPTPCTPLRQKVDEDKYAAFKKSIGEGNVDGFLAENNEVGKRAYSVRRLYKSGVKTISLYSQEKTNEAISADKIKKEEVDIFKGLIKQEEKNSKSWSCLSYGRYVKEGKLAEREAKSFDDGLTGATYIFTDKSGKTHGFSLLGSQKHEAGQGKEWSLSYAKDLNILKSKSGNPKFEEQFNDITKYLKANDVNLFAEITRNKVNFQCSIC